MVEVVFFYLEERNAVNSLTKELSKNERTEQMMTERSEAE